MRSEGGKSTAFTGSCVCVSMRDRTTAFAPRDEVCEAFARDEEEWGWESPWPSYPCRGASLSRASPDPPGKVQGGRVTSLLPWARAEGRVLGLGTLGGRQGTVQGLGCGALPAAPQRGPAALRPSGAGQRPREGASGCSSARPSLAGWTCI